MQFCFDNLYTTHNPNFQKVFIITIGYKQKWSKDFILYNIIYVNQRTILQAIIIHSLNRFKKFDSPGCL